MAGTSIEDTASCLSDAELRALLGDGEPSGNAEEHLGNCEECRRRLENLAGVVTLDVVAADTRITQSEALDTAMRDLKEYPVELKRDLQSWLSSVGSEEAEGDLLGLLEGYELQRVIGEGGMGLVLQARDLRLDRAVAIKLIKPSLAGGKVNRERLLKEARAAASIEHDRVVPIYAAELTTTGGVPFIVMPYVSRGTLQDKMDAVKEPFPLAEVIGIGEQVADALAAAHEAGVIHRDVKPANVLLRGDQQIWVTDFGIARALSEIQSSNEREISGTPQFMAPEQIQGKQSDHRADLFGLGAVLYGMATGKPAFEKDASEEIPLPTLEANPELPKWLAELIDRLLEKNPIKRPQTAREVREHLLERGAPTSSRRLLPFAIWAAAALAVLLGVLWYAHKPAWRAAPFVITSQNVGFHTLPDAIAAAEPGATIAFQRSGLVYQGILPLIDKPLRLKAVHGASPRIEGVSGMKPFIRTSAPLVLEGIHLAIDCGGGAEMIEPIAPPIIEAEAALAVTNCVFAHTRVGDDGGRYRAALVLLESVDSAVFTNTVFVNRASAVAISGEIAQIDLENCLVVTRTGFFPKLLGEPAPEIKVRHSAFHVRELALWKERNPVLPLSIEVVSSVLNVEGAAFVLPGRTLRNVSNIVQYRGRDNLYNEDARAYLALEPARRVAENRMRLNGLSTLPEWLDYWNLSDSNSKTQSLPINDSLERLHTETSEALEGDLRAASELQDCGIDQALLGPGVNYHHYTGTAAYESWAGQAAVMLSSVHKMK